MNGNDMSCTVKKALFLNVKLIFQNLGCAICATFTKSVFKRCLNLKIFCCVLLDLLEKKLFNQSTWDNFRKVIILWNCFQYC